MSRKLRVGLTGGLATGKSKVLAELKRLGAEAICADELAHEALAEAGMARRVARRFGRSVLRPDGTVDRKALGRIVFRNASGLRALERLLHPVVRREMDRRAAGSRRAVVVEDVPLLFETGMQGRYDLVVVVDAPERAQAARLRARDGLSPSESRRRIRLQWPTGRKAELADVVLDNGRPWSRVRPVVRSCYRALELLASINT